MTGFPEPVEYVDPFNRSGDELTRGWADALNNRAEAIRDKHAQAQAEKARQAQIEASAVAFLETAFNRQEEN